MNKIRLNHVLWAIQGLLAGIFMFAGIAKLVLPIQDMTAQIHLPGPFLRFIGVAEVLGALGLLLPGRLKIWKGLTPLAAAGLVIIMIGAVVVSVQAEGVKMALFPAATGLLAAFVAWGRRPGLKAE